MGGPFFFTKFTMEIDAWNKIEKDSETNATAVEGDVVFCISGIMFLIQTKNGFNNIVCKRVQKSEVTLLSVLKALRIKLDELGLQYIRVEGSLRRYNFLYRLETMLRISVLRDPDVVDRNVFYIKLM